VALFRARARRAGIKEVTIAGRNVRFAPVVLPDSRVVRLQRMYPKSIVKPPVETLLVPRPLAPVGGRPVPQPITGMALLEWARGVIDAVIHPSKES
jgi:transcription-repair coupling factor (superfamily II helicase)